MITTIEFEAKIIGIDKQDSERVHGDVRWHRPEAWTVTVDKKIKQLVHIRVHHDESPEGTRPYRFYTQLGFWVYEDHAKAFPIGRIKALSNMELRAMAYPISDNAHVIVDRTQTIELLYDGNDPLAGVDYFIPQGDPARKRPFVPNSVQTNDQWAKPAEIKEDLEVEVLKWK